MKLITVSILSCIATLGLTLWLEELVYFYLLILSLMPLNLLYWSTPIVKLHSDKTLYSGPRLVLYPPIIYGFLLFAYNVTVG
jgi:hypothetical protein